MGKAVRFDGDYEINVPDGSKIIFDVGQTGSVQVSGTLAVTGNTTVNNISSFNLLGGAPGYTIITDGQGNLTWENPNFGIIGYTGSQGVIGYTGSQGEIGYTGSRGFHGVSEISFNMLGELYIGQGVARWYITQNATITGVLASVATPPIDDVIVFDIKKNGTSIFTTIENRPTIQSGEFVDTTTRIPDDVNLVVGDYLTLDVLNIGFVEAGSGGIVRIAIQRLPE